MNGIFVKKLENSSIEQSQAWIIIFIKTGKLAWVQFLIQHGSLGTELGVAPGSTSEYDLETNKQNTSGKCGLGWLGNSSNGLKHKPGLWMP